MWPGLADNFSPIRWSLGRSLTAPTRFGQPTLSLQSIQNSGMRLITSSLWRQGRCSSLQSSSGHACLSTKETLQSRHRANVAPHLVDGGMPNAPTLQSRTLSILLLSQRPLKVRAIIFSLLSRHRKKIEQGGISKEIFVLHYLSCAPATAQVWQTIITARVASCHPPALNAARTLKMFCTFMPTPIQLRTSVMTVWKRER